MLLESGPASRDRNYNIIFALVLVAFSGYFYYDGKWGYISKNREDARRFLASFAPKDAAFPDEFGPTPDEPDYRRLAQVAPITIDQVRDTLKMRAQYTARGPAGETTAEYFVSDYGVITVPVNGERVAGEVKWQPWAKSRSEIEAQFYWALAPLVLAAVFVSRVIRNLRLRVTIDEQGMTYAGLRISVANMRRLAEYSPKGLASLYYVERDGGPERRLRLDDQKVQKFDEIIDVLCRLKGFPDPRVAADGEKENAK